MPLFDAYIFVDWSAKSGRHPQHPVPNAVWSGEFIPKHNYQCEKYHRTRHDGIAYILRVLLEHVKFKHRVLLGFDFPYGYPAGFAKALRLPGGAQSWWEVWAELAHRIEDTANNINNRFIVAGELNTIAGDGQAGPFWGCPVGTEIINLHPTSPGFPFVATGGALLKRLRLAETQLPGTQEAWGLYGQGRVGSQALVGIPYLYKLHSHPELAPLSSVWPFETQFAPTPTLTKGPFILHAEIWPGVVKEKVYTMISDNPELIRDRAQVRAMCEWAAELDAQDALGDYFAQPNGLNSQQIQACTEEEGWILGAR